MDIRNFKSNAKPERGLKWVSNSRGEISKVVRGCEFCAYIYVFACSDQLSCVSGLR